MEDYKKKYEAALEWARSVMQGKTGFVLDEVLEKFPELKESGDEKIKKAIIRYLNREITLSNFGGDIATFKEWIAWLEKQGEQKPADKIEPKFKVGDWITNDRYVKLVVGINSDFPFYMFEDETSKRIKDIDKRYHLWTIKDARNGDVLANKNGAIFINAGNTGEDRVTLDCYCYLSVQGAFYIEERKTGSWLYKTEIQPATKEQYNLLFQKMKEAGYEWDTENKELKNIEQKRSSEVNDEALQKQLQIWFDKGKCSGKDEVIFHPEKFGLQKISEQKPVWSEEDEKLIEEVADSLRKYSNYVQGGNSKVYVLSLADSIESLQPRYTWKPSDEQMDALNLAIGEANSVDTAAGDEAAEILTSLYEQLKKLREE